MDPVTALAQVVKSITDLVIEIIKGQTPEQKQKIWDWYIADVERWRRFFKLDGPPKA